MGTAKEKPSGTPDSITRNSGILESVVNRSTTRVQLDIALPALPEAIDVLGEHWVRKSEFHVTLIGPGQKLEVDLKSRDPSLSKRNAKALVKDAIDKTLEGKSFRVVAQDELRIAQDKDRKTIVRMCQVEGVDDFFTDLSQRLGFPVEVPPTHITLYTLRNGWPIGIYNDEQLRKTTRKLTNVEAQEVRNLIGLADAISGRNYAWGKLARNISEDAIKQTLEGTEGDFLLVDLCSAFPLFARILRERHKKERCYPQAKKIVGELAQTLETSSKRMPEELKGDFNDTEEMSDKNRKLRDAITPKGAPLRKVLTSLVEDFLYDPAQIDEGDSKNQIAERLLNLFGTYDIIYEDVFELEEKVGRGRWQIRNAKETGITPHSEFTRILDNEADKFMNGLSVFLAKKILPNLRKFSVISLDISTPQELRGESLRSFPDEFINTEFYRRINKLEDHMLGDMARPPFQPESVSFYACFEGWPFSTFGLDERQTKDMVLWILLSLKPGGKALFFPWQVQGETPKERRQLEDIEKFWQLMGAKIARKEFTRDELKQQMVDRELVLVDHSPVFKEPNDVFTALILEKP